MSEIISCERWVQPRPVLCGDMRIDAHWNRFRGHRIPYWTLAINDRLGASVRPDGGPDHALVPHQVHLIPAWVRFDCHTTREVQHLWSIFDLTGIPGSLVRAVFPTIRTLPLDACLASLADRMRQGLAGDPRSPGTQCAITALHEAVAQDLFAQLTPAERARLFAASIPECSITPALALIESRPDRLVSNRALASACGMSEHHFLRQFRRQVGQTPVQYRLERRIAKGALQLATTEHPIEAIAADCGFSDRYYFTRIFTRKMGLAPAAYRQRRLTGQPEPPRASSPVAS